MSDPQGPVPGPEHPGSPAPSRPPGHDGYPSYPGYPPGYPGYAGYPGYPGYPGYAGPGPADTGHPPPDRATAPPAPPDARWAFPHEEPREYHEILRTWTYRTWKPVVGILLLLAGLLVVVPLVAFPILLVGAVVEANGRDYLDTVLEAATMERLTPSGLLYLNLALGGMILWCGGLVRFLHHLRPRWLSSVLPRLRWRFLAACTGLAVVALVAQVVVGVLMPTTASAELTTEANAVTGTTIALALVVLLTTPLQAAGEEYAFRGYLLQAIGALARHRWVTIVLTALLFAVAHLQFNPPVFFDRFMFGLIAAWLVIRTGGLEAGIALHVLNNYLVFGFAIAFTDLESTLDPGDVTWWNVPVTLTQSFVYAALVLWLAKRMNVQRTTRPPHLEVPPASSASVTSNAV